VIRDRRMANGSMAQWLNSQAQIVYNLMLLRQVCNIVPAGAGKVHAALKGGVALQRRGKEQ
jgi:hypothetical protein